MNEKDFSLKKPVVDKLYTVDVDGIDIDVPAVYDKVSATMSFFPISYKKARHIINNERVFPVKIFPNTAIFAITVFDYKDSPAGPYREVALSIPSTIDREIPLLPLLADSLFNSFGFYTILLFMDTDMGIKHSRKVYGYPVYEKKVTIDIDDNESCVKVDAYEGGKKILSIKTKKFKRYNLMKNKLYNTFFMFGKELKKVEMTVDAFMAEKNLGNGCECSFGEHEIYNKYIKDLLMTDKPLRYMHYTNATEILSQPYKI